MLARNAGFRRRGTAGDPYWANVSLLLHMDGADLSTVFTDSKNAAVATVSGNAKISTAQYKYGGASGAFDGNGDIITFPSIAGYNLAGSDFTIECWARFAGYPNNHSGLYKACLVGKDKAPSGGASRGFAFNVVGTASSITSLEFTAFSSDTPVYQSINASYTFALNTWYHIAVVRIGNFLYLFVNGVLLNVGGSAFTVTIQDTPNTTLRVGGLLYDANFAYYLNGNLDEVRITKGVGRYSTNFTAPSEAFPNS